MSRMMSPGSPMGGVMGMNSPESGMAQQANVTEEIKAVMGQIREMNGLIDGIASTFPVASGPFDEAKAKLMEALKSIIANSAGSEPAATRTF